MRADSDPGAPPNNFAPIAGSHQPISSATADMSLRLRIGAALFGDPGGDLAAGGESQFGQDVRDVGLGCSLGDDQRSSDGLVAQALREQSRDFLLTRGQRARAAGVGLSRSL